MSSIDGKSALYPVDADGHAASLLRDRVVDLPAPVLLLGDPEPQPILHDGSRRMLVAHPNGPVGGVDLESEDVAQSGYLDGAARCLPNGSHGVAGSRLFVWGAADCTFGSHGPERPVLVEVGWDANTR